MSQRMPVQPIIRFPDAAVLAVLLVPPLAACSPIPGRNDTGVPRLEDASDANVTADLMEAIDGLESRFVPGVRVDSDSASLTASVRDAMLDRGLSVDGTEPFRIDRRGEDEQRVVARYGTLRLEKRYPAPIGQPMRVTLMPSQEAIPSPPSVSGAGESTEYEAGTAHYSIVFPAGSSEPALSSNEVLELIAERLDNESSESQLLILGEAHGMTTYPGRNAQLAADRAESIARSVAGFGVPWERITISTSASGDDEVASRGGVSVTIKSRVDQES